MNYKKILMVLFLTPCLLGIKGIKVQAEETTVYKDAQVNLTRKIDRISIDNTKAKENVIDVLTNRRLEELPSREFIKKAIRYGSSCMIYKTQMLDLKSGVMNTFNKVDETGKASSMGDCQALEIVIALNQSDDVYRPFLMYKDKNNKLYCRDLVNNEYFSWNGKNEVLGDDMVASERYILNTSNAELRENSKQNEVIETTEIDMSLADDVCIDGDNITQLKDSKIINFKIVKEKLDILVLE